MSLDITTLNKRPVGDSAGGCAGGGGSPVRKKAKTECEADGSEAEEGATTPVTPGGVT